MGPTEYLTMVRRSVTNIFGNTAVDIGSGPIKPLPNGLVPGINAYVFVQGVGTYTWGVVATGDLPETFSSVDELASHHGVTMKAYLFKLGIGSLYRRGECGLDVVESYRFLGIESDNLKTVTTKQMVRRDFEGVDLERAVVDFLHHTKETIVVE